MVDNDPNRRDRVGAPVAGRKSWLPWVIGGIVLLLLILLLRGCGDDEATVATGTGEDTAAMAPADGTAGMGAGGAMTPGQATAWNANEFGTYLGGTEPVGRSFALERVTFASGSALLNADARAQINEVAAALKSRPSARVSLRGYADPAGDAAANQALSEQRTAAVRNALVDAGATAAQVAATSAMGETGTDTNVGNRRVEITVTAR
jgi:outer membrane protein OmpA-like peptidoglycan-associated protein